MVGVVSFRFRVCCFTWKNISSNFATLHLVLADRRATAWTTTSLSHAASRQKNHHLRIFNRIEQGMRTRNVPSVKMLLEQRFGLYQCQGRYGQPVRSNGRIPFEGVSAMVSQIAKHPCTCRHQWNSNPIQGLFEIWRIRSSRRNSGCLLIWKKFC